MNNKNFFYHNTYLSTFDLLNKYNLKTIYKLPELKTLKIELNLTSLQNILSITNANELKIKIFLFLYLLNSIPLVGIEKTIIKKQKDSKENDLNFLISLKIKNKKNIENFLFFIFYESWTTLRKENISFKTVKNKMNQNYFYLNANAPAFIFKLFENILNDKDVFDLNTKDLYLDLSFCIKKNIKSNSNKNILDNLCPFFFIQ